MKRKMLFIWLFLLAYPVLDIISGGEETKEDAGKIVVYLIGDSTCANKTAAAYPETGWGQKLQQFFNSSNVTIDNRALNGRSSKSFIAENRWSSIMSTIKAGDWVFIQFGHNDQKIEKPAVGTSIEEYTANLTRYVTDTRAKGAYPVILTSIVRRLFSGNTLKQSLGEYPDAARQVAANLGVPLIDMEAKTRAVVSALGPEKTKELYLWVTQADYPNLASDKTDNTHLSPIGAERFASLVIEGIRELHLEALTANIVPAENSGINHAKQPDKVSFSKDVVKNLNTTQLMPILHLLHESHL